MKSKLKIYTSFVSPKTLEKYISEGYLPVFILRSIVSSELIGEWSGTALHLKHLSPSSELFREKRDKKIDIETFKKKYILESSNTDFEHVINKLETLAELSNAKGIVMLGYGSDNSVCHRSVLAELLNESGLLEHKVAEIIF